MFRIKQHLFISVFISCVLIITLVYRHTTFDLTHALFSTDTLPQPISDALQFYKPKVPPPLASRLQSFLRAPLLTYRDAFAQNMLTCGTIERADRQVNPDQLRKQKLFWRGVGNLELAQRRMALVRHLESIGERKPLLGEPNGGRGIVMTGGNKDTTQRLLVILRILRFEYHCHLPVEVFSFPGEITSSEVIHELSSLNASLIELTGHKKLRQWKNFQIKADAIIASSFEEVLYLDSDNIPLKNPTHLFESPLYSDVGQPKAIFWPDLNKDHPSNAIWRLIGRQCYSDEWEIETGQILISKTGNNGLNLAALHVAAHMQLDNQFYFRLSEGDKDTFRYAFWALGIPYSVSPRWMSSVGFNAPWDNERFCGIAMLQYDIEPMNSSKHPFPLFMHANLLKHRQRMPAPTSGNTTDPFTLLKRFSDDFADARSLDNARMWVYGNLGMCIELEVSRPVTHGEKVIIEHFPDVYDGKFRDFTDMYRRYGGKDGGW